MNGYTTSASDLRCSDELRQRVFGFGSSPVSGWRAVVKRLLDIGIGLVLLLLLLLPMLLIAAAVRLESAGPIIYTQVRVGQYGRRFTILKFRTMSVTDEAAEAILPTQIGPTQPLKQRCDPRVTPLGRRLRRSSLDELPQLLNVLKGDMSIVGPRPELPHIVDSYADWQHERLLVPQGLTGWWQVNGRGERAMHLHTEDDIFYVRQFSLRLDLKILVKTVPAVLTGTGAF